MTPIQSKVFALALSLLLCPAALAQTSADTHDHDEEHAEEHHGHEEKHNEDYGDADEHERHSEFSAKYQFVCKKPDRLSQIVVRLFHAFPAIEYIEVQLINETKQTAMELTAKKNKIAW